VSSVVFAAQPPVTLNIKIDLLKSRAQSGNAVDQYLLGYLYLTPNTHIDVDPKSAIIWLNRAAAQDHADAMVLLGDVYRTGRGADIDLKQSFKWYQQAALTGNRTAMNHLGLFYSMGLVGDRVDCGKAIGWYEKAIDLGSDLAEGNLVWLLSTCPDARFRDGQRAVLMGMEHIARLGQLTATDLDNMAAAYAETGDFRQAIEFQQRAIALLDDEDSGERHASFKKRLNFYQQGKAWRDVSFDGGYIGKAGW
jgi:TPR repeat protein